MGTVGILGGTCPAGRGVAVRLASAGYDVVLGSRDAQRATSTAAEIVVRGTGTVGGASNEEVAQCDVIVVATPWDSAVATVRGLKELLANKVVISMVNALWAQAYKRSTMVKAPRTLQLKPTIFSSSNQFFVCKAYSSCWRYGFKDEKCEMRDHIL